MKMMMCCFFLLLSSCSTIDPAPHTEVASDLMWVVNDGRVMTVTCKRPDGYSEKLKVTEAAFQTPPKSGIILSTLDILVGVAMWISDIF